MTIGRPGHFEWAFPFNDTATGDYQDIKIYPYISCSDRKTKQKTHDNAIMQAYIYSIFFKYTKTSDRYAVSLCTSLVRGAR